MKEQKKENTTGGIPMVKDSSVTLAESVNRLEKVEAKTTAIEERLNALEKKFAAVEATIKELMARLAKR
jgi:predicted transcriptional regulator